MTPDELRKRCKQLIDSIYGPRAEGNMGAIYDEYVQETESLCREMIGVGLERACAYYSNQIHHDMDDYPDKFVNWCRQEAQRVKENHDTKEA